MICTAGFTKTFYVLPRQCTYVSMFGERLLLS